jgi:hypothetical protein
MDYITIPVKMAFAGFHDKTANPLNWGMYQWAAAAISMLGYRWYEGLIFSLPSDLIGWAIMLGIGYLGGVMLFGFCLGVFMMGIVGFQ